MQFSSAELLQQLSDKQDLTAPQVEWLAEELIAEQLTEDEKADLLRALTSKGESVSELVGFVKTFLRHAVHPQFDQDENGPAIDVCGTGGDKLDLFNVSTTSMFVLAGGGAVVVKHGNRGITSKSGGADVLEALGIRIDLTPAQFLQCVQRTGVGFMFAPNYHPAFKNIVPIRKRLAAEGTRTVFNLIGPLLNPVQPYFQLVGVADGKLPMLYAEILKGLGRVRAWAVHGTTQEGAGMDELSTLGDSKIAQVHYDQIAELTLQPSDIGLPAATLADLKGGDAQENAKILHGILAGEIKGPKRDIVVLNAAAGFMITSRASSWPEALALANQVIDRGAALKALQAVQQFCLSVA
jgi:anthranilate phosphoribosyltransferase